MILGLLYSVVRALLDLLVLCRKTEATLVAQFIRLARSFLAGNEEAVGRCTVLAASEGRAARPHESKGNEKEPEPGP